MAAAEDLRANKCKSERKKLRNVVAIVDSGSYRCVRRRGWGSLKSTRKLGGTNWVARSGERSIRGYRIKARAVLESF
jgi:hypothetical protein